MPITQEIYRVLTTVHLHINWKAHLACDLNFLSKVEDFSGSQAVTYTESGNNSEMVPDRDVITDH